MFNKLFDLMDEHRPIGYVVGGACLVAFIALMMWGGYLYQRSIQVNSQTETICKMIKPEMLNPGVCE